MIGLIKKLIGFNKRKRIRDKCTCEHNYDKCAKKISVSDDGVISVSHYARCGSFMTKVNNDFKKISESIIIASDK